MRKATPLIGATLLQVALVLCGCSGGPQPSGNPATSAQPSVSANSPKPSASAPGAEVEVTSEVTYGSPLHTAGSLPPLLDVYAPRGAQHAPLVVMFHGAGIAVTKDSSPYPDLARAIAAEGAVVVVANWGTHSMPWEFPIGRLLPMMRLFAGEGACVVSYAVAHAAEYGADPGRLVLFGHSAGATEAGLAGLTEDPPYPECKVRTTTWKARGMMLWDGDFLLANPGFDVLGKDTARLLRIMTPYPSLQSARHVDSVEFAVSRSSRNSFSTPKASKDAEWLAWRDPSGEMQQVLDELGAFKDGWLDVGEEAMAMVAGLKAQGINASLLTFTDPTTTHEDLAEGDFDLMVEHVLALAGRGSHRKGGGWDLRTVRDPRSTVRSDLVARSADDNAGLGAVQ